MLSKENKTRLTDDALRDLLNNGVPQGNIAALYHISRQAVHARIKSMEIRALACAPAAATRAAERVWDVQTACQSNYERALSLLDICETPGDKTRVIGEIRQHLQFAMQVIQTLYSAQEVQAFQEEVLLILQEVEPSARDRIIARLRERRSVRAAFMEH